ncbi:hypothetical protein TARUN_1516 [Trichoderma arundinaceum]|uniref:Uncharacterized protein n=1 Tax=Trichoderma arundinaceum TaxID=490622 RepID=A0A395NX47_TRIAR|nr:hypothetical protein TARUN_1516 [Trichoderma arundinaceum]
MLKSRFVNETSSASFQLLCPIRVKGIESQSHIIGQIHTRSIVLFDFDENPEVPEVVRKKLNCGIVRLHLELHRPLDLIASAVATEPIQPRKRLSGEAFDALRSLSNATALDIYISARVLSQVKLAAVRKAASQNLLLPLCPDISTTLASLYDGSGGKVIRFSSSQDKTSISLNDRPPSYDELEPPPSHKAETSPPHKSNSTLSISTFNRSSGKKRRRLEDSSTASEIDNYQYMWDTLTNMRKEMHKLAKRVERLEKENKHLNKELDNLRASCEKATDAVDADGTALLEVHEDLNELKVQVDFLAQGGLDSDVEEHIVETVKHSVLTHILERGYNTKITIEKS